MNDIYNILYDIMIRALLQYDKDINL